MRLQSTLIATAISLAASLPATAQDVADKVYTNGRIYTVNVDQPWAEALAIHDGKFIAVGSSADIKATIGSDTEVIDLNGAFVMPGFVDGHLHPPLVYAQEEAGNLRMNSQTADELKAKILEYAAANPGDGWIRGEKYSITVFPDGRLTKDWLDAIVPDRPVLIYDEGLHSAAANSKALEIAGISKDTPTPEGGVIAKGPDGEPNGFLAETAIALVGRHVPKIPSEAWKTATERALYEATALGITSFVDAYLFPSSFEVYLELEEAGELNFRIAAATALNDYTDEFATLEEAAELMERAPKTESELIKFDSFKFWLDGTPLSFTSIMVDGYSNKDTKGKITMTEAQFARARELLDQGLMGRFHAIGSGSIRMTLDLVEEFREANPDNTRPVHLAHASLVHPDDRDRLKELNVIAEVSPPVWFAGPWDPLQVEYIGAWRAASWAPVAELHSVGATVAVGSDWPAGTSTADPFRGLEGLVTRMHPYGEVEGRSGIPVRLEDALVMMTLNSAKLMEMSDEIGSIEVGKFADMIVLDQNLFEIDPSAISDTRVTKTVFNGEIVFDAAMDPPPKTKR